MSQASISLKLDKLSKIEHESFADQYCWNWNDGHFACLRHNVLENTAAGLPDQEGKLKFLVLIETGWLRRTLWLSWHWGTWPWYVWGCGAGVQKRLLSLWAIVRQVILSWSKLGQEQRKNANYFCIPVQEYLFWNEICGSNFTEKHSPSDSKIPNQCTSTWTY